jgi:hypothetical protein
MAGITTMNFLEELKPDRHISTALGIVYRNGHALKQ